MFKLFSLSVLVFFVCIGNAISEDNVDKKEVQDIERVEVLGERPKRFYLSEYRRIQMDYVNHFNDLVDDRDMEVVCSIEKSTMSRVKKRNCQPRFMKTIVSKETQRELSMGSEFLDIGNLSERPVVQQAMLKEYVKFLELTTKLLNENPELANKYSDVEGALAKVKNFGKD